MLVIAYIIAIILLLKTVLTPVDGFVIARNKVFFWGRNNMFFNQIYFIFLLFNKYSTQLFQ